MPEILSGKEEFVDIDFDQPGVREAEARIQLMMKNANKTLMLLKRARKRGFGGLDKGDEEWVAELVGGLRVIGGMQQLAVVKQNRIVQ